MTLLENGRIERLLRHDGAAVMASVALITLLAWAYLIVLAIDMRAGDMRLMGMAGGMMDMAPRIIAEPRPWTWITFVLMGLMWWIMMTGMMLPSAAPMILLFARLQRHKLADQAPGRRIVLFTLGYLVMWLGFSLAATAAQWALSALTLLSPMMKATSPLLAAALFAAAGAYQFTRLKHACLAHCRAPVHFLTRYWRKGDFGAFRMGLHHGAYCVGCCWVLMALLFAGGVMNLLWVAAIALMVLLEKLLPGGVWLSRASGAAMLGIGAGFAGLAMSPAS